MDKETLGDFRIISQIGKGPLGDLYLGEHKFMKKRYAIKVLPSELVSNEEFLERFEKKIGHVCQLEHLNLAKVHTVSSQDGVYYLVTDYIADPYGESTNLSSYLGSLNKRLTEDEVFSILRQVAYALDYIHGVRFDEKSMAHGGLKLNNILVGKFKDDVPHIYLTDVGLSSVIGAGAVLSRTLSVVAAALEVSPEVSGLEAEKRFASQSTDASKLNKLHRSFLQNYAFLAPEQKLGASGSSGPKSDVYAFGVLSYFLLMGYLPEGYFKMPSSTGASYKRDWDLLIEATLRQNPADRPDSLTALLAQIEKRELSSVESQIKRVAIEEAKPKDQERVIPPQPEKRVEESKPKTTPITSPYYASNSVLSSLEQQLTQTGSVTRVNPIAKPEVKKPEPVQEPERQVATAIATMDEQDQEECEKQVLIKPSELKKLEYEEDPGAIFKAPKVVESYKPQKKEVHDVEPIMTEMIVCDGGEYMRGSNIGARDEKPRHKVVIEGFAIDIHPVTNEQFVRFLDVMGSEKNADNNDMILLKESRIKRVGGKLIIESGYTKHPVVGVSWYGACAYAKWIGKRLPTEAEWEIAASFGKEENIYPCGREIERSGANFFSSDTTPVMSYPPNERGLYDMAGNVYEWCEDWYGYNYYETSIHEPNSPTGPAQGVYRVLRGGCWKSLVEDMRCSHRHRNNPGTMNRTYGFRLAADVQ